MIPHKTSSDSTSTMLSINKKRSYSRDLSNFNTSISNKCTIKPIKVDNSKNIQPKRNTINNHGNLNLIDNYSIRPGKVDHPKLLILKTNKEALIANTPNQSQYKGMPFRDVYDSLNEAEKKDAIYINICELENKFLTNGLAEESGDINENPQEMSRLRLEVEKRHPRILKGDKLVKIPCCKSRLGFICCCGKVVKSDFGELGIGVIMYFKVIKTLLIAFFFISLFSSALCYIYYNNGNNKNILSFTDRLFQTTIGNIASSLYNCETFELSEFNRTSHKLELDCENKVISKVVNFGISEEDKEAKKDTNSTEASIKDNNKEKCYLAMSTEELQISETVCDLQSKINDIIKSEQCIGQNKCSVNIDITDLECNAPDNETLFFSYSCYEDNINLGVFGIKVKRSFMASIIVIEDIICTFILYVTLRVIKSFKGDNYNNFLTEKTFIRDFTLHLTKVNIPKSEIYFEFDKLIKHFENVAMLEGFPEMLFKFNKVPKNRAAFSDYLNNREIMNFKARNYFIFDLVYPVLTSGMTSEIKKFNKYRENVIQQKKKYGINLNELENNELKNNNNKEKDFIIKEDNYTNNDPDSSGEILNPVKIYNKNFSKMKETNYMPEKLEEKFDVTKDCNIVKVENEVKKDFHFEFNNVKVDNESNNYVNLELKDAKESNAINVAKQDFNAIKQDVYAVKQDFNAIKQDVNPIKQDVNVVNQDVNVAKEEANVVNRDVNVAKENVNVVAKEEVKEEGKEEAKEEGKEEAKEEDKEEDKLDLGDLGDLEDADDKEDKAAREAREAKEAQKALEAKKAREAREAKKAKEALQAKKAQEAKAVKEKQKFEKKVKEVRNILNTRLKKMGEIKQKIYDETENEPIDEIYIIFRNYKIANFFRELYKIGWCLRTLKGSSISHLYYENQWLHLDFAKDEPTNIKWENRNITCFSKFFRSLVSIFLTLIFLIITVVSVVFLTMYEDKADSEYNTNLDCDGSVKGWDNETLVYQEFTDKSISDKNKQLSYCYCYDKINAKSLINDEIAKSKVHNPENETDYEFPCEKFIENYAKAKSLSIALVVAIPVFNAIMTFILGILTEFQKNATLSQDLTSNLWKMFIIQFINTGLVLLIVNIKIDNYNFPKIFGITLFSGNFKDLDPEWYDKVGATIIFSTIIGVFTPYIFDLAPIIINLIKRYRDSGRTCGKITKKKKKKEYFDLYTGPTFSMDSRYADILANLAVTLVFSSGIPILNVVFFVYLIILYYIDKTFTVCYYRIPPKYDLKVVELFLTISLIGVFIHLLFGIWIYGNPNILVNLNAEDKTELIKRLKEYLNTFKRGSFAKDVIERITMTHNIPLVLCIVGLILYKFVQKILLNILGILFCCCCCKKKEKKGKDEQGIINDFNIEIGLALPLPALYKYYQIKKIEYFNNVKKMKEAPNLFLNEQSSIHYIKSFMSYRMMKLFGKGKTNELSNELINNFDKTIEDNSMTLEKEKGFAIEGDVSYNLAFLPEYESVTFYEYLKNM